MTTVHPPSAPSVTGAHPGELAHPERSAHPGDFDSLEVVSIEVIPDGVAESRTGERLRRLEQRRRLVREELMAVLVLVVALSVTVAVLAMQWLDSSGGMH